jgi:hypothetical protein
LANRLEAERERALDKGFDISERLRAHTARTDYKLDLAERLIEAMTRTYSDPRFYAKAVVVDLHRTIQQRGELPTASPELGPFAPTPPGPDRLRLEELDSFLGHRVTLADIEATELPPTLNGRQPRPSFKKAQVIRATKALLMMVGWATIHEIL